MLHLALAILAALAGLLVAFYSLLAVLWFAGLLLALLTWPIRAAFTHARKHRP